MIRQIQQVKPTEPCIHCGKPDWCYRLGELTVCKREAAPAKGWEATSKSDADGSRYFAPLPPQKLIRPAQKRSWEYPARNGSPLIQIRREDYGDGRKAYIRPWRWTGQEWVQGYEGHVDRVEIPVYRLDEVKRSIAAGTPIFIVEGEPCADALRSLGLVATTNIGGSKKWRDSDSADLTGAQVILCPDRDAPGLAHMERIAQDFPHAQWLYAFPDLSAWNNLPSSQGLDVADWVQDYKLTKEEVLNAVGSKRQASPVGIVEVSQKNQKKKSDWTFMDICSHVKEIRQLSDPGEQKWEMLRLAKQVGCSVAHLYEVYDKARQNQPTFDLTDGLEVLSKSPEKFDWLVAGLLPMATTALLYAEGGTGKTLLTNSIIKAVTCGQNWNGFPTRHGKVLLIQTDEPSIVMAQNLKIAGFQSSLPPGQLLINSNWQFTQMAQLREAIATHQPVLVVIDSLTSSNRTATVEEKDVEYARCLYDLRDIAMELGVAILILHHENKTGGVRGSTAIKANVSEVWHLARNNTLAPTQRLLDVEKSRSGCSGLFQLELDVDDYSWQHQGDFDPSQAGQSGDRPIASLPLKARLLNFLEERPGVSFEPEELVAEFGGNRDAIRKTLERLWRSGLIQFEQREKTTGQGNKSRYRIYFYPELSNSSESLATQDVELLDKLSNNNNAPQPVREPVREFKSPPVNDFDAIGQTNSRTDSNRQTDSPPNIFPVQSAPHLSRPHLVPQPGVAPKVSDFVMTPTGQGIVKAIYSNGQLGVELEGGRSFSAWSVSEITVLGFN